MTIIDGEQALHIAVKAIQDSMGVKYGDFAGIYFGGNPNWEDAVLMLDNYIQAEKDFREK